MPALNRVQLIGYLGRDPESKYTPTGKRVTDFPIAVTNRWKDEAGETKEHTEWVNIEAWEHLAEVCHETGDLPAALEHAAIEQDPGLPGFHHQGIAAATAAEGGETHGDFRTSGKQEKGGFSAISRPGASPPREALRDALFSENPGLR